MDCGVGFDLLVRSTLVCLFVCDLWLFKWFACGFVCLLVLILICLILFVGLLGDVIPLLAV